MLELSKGHQCNLPPQEDLSILSCYTKSEIKRIIMKRLLILAAAVALIGAGCFSRTPEQPPAGQTGGTDQQQTRTEEFEAPDRNNPITFDVTGGQFAVEKGLTTFNQMFTVESLAELSDTCGTGLDATHFQEVLESFTNRRGLIYTFLYRGDSPEPTKYTLTVVENGPDYATTDDFRKDFGVCGDNNNLRPLTLNHNWLVFESGCGGDADATSGCMMIRAQLEGTMEVH